MYRSTRLHVAIDDQFRYAVLDVGLDSSLQRTCTKLHIVALLSHKLLGLVAQLYLISQVADALEHTLQLYVDNLLDSLQIQLVEGDNLVQTVQEFRRELL